MPYQSKLKMVIPLFREKPRKLRRDDEPRGGFCYSLLALLILILFYLWSSTTTIISGRFDPIPLHQESVAATRLIRETYPEAGDDSIVENPAKPVLKKGTSRNDSWNNNHAVMAVEELLRVQRSWAAASSNNFTEEYVRSNNCEGRGIYVYDDLPAKFNRELVSECGHMVVDMCKYFTNDGMGEPINELGDCWYKTHQYSLEPIFHARVLNHPCRVYNPDEAKLFYVPYYAGMDILRWHFKNVSNEVKDKLALELVNWLEMQTPWGIHLGKDHVFVLGKITWDFRRTNNDSSWGNAFLELEQMANPLKLLIERNPWELNEVGVPHPTFFHPRSDDDIISWQHMIINANRNSLVSFAGAARPNDPGSIRTALINQCTTAAGGNCRFLDCRSGMCKRPESIIGLFMESEFCLQPPGDSPTRKSVFDSLIAGCIPVLFDRYTAYYQYPWHLPEDHERYSVFVDKEDVREMKVNVVERLMKIPLKERDEMRRYIIYELMPGLVYGDPNANLEKFQDAFAISINNLLARVDKLD